MEIDVPADGSARQVSFFFADGYQGPGQPVKNGITSAGRTIDAASGRLVLGECAFQVMVFPPGLQKPGDTDQNGQPEMNDAIQLLGHLFRGDPAALPCDGLAANRLLLDGNGDGEMDVSDAVHQLHYLFLGSPLP